MQIGHIALLIATSLTVALASSAPARAPSPPATPVIQRPGAPTVPPSPPTLPAPLPKPRIADSELRCLAMTVYWEANLEPRIGKSAVAHVVLNRVGQAGFPNTICGVVQQGGRRFPCQFQWYCSGRDIRPTDDKWWEESQEIAREALDGKDPTQGALYFHQAALKLEGERQRGGVRVIGRHIFFRTWR